jgi:hypothetical protein
MAQVVTAHADGKTFSGGIELTPTGARRAGWRVRISFTVPEPFQTRPIGSDLVTGCPLFEPFPAVFLVERTGIEPVTSGLQSRRSPS